MTILDYIALIALALSNLLVLLLLAQQENTNKRLYSSVIHQMEDLEMKVSCQQIVTDMQVREFRQHNEQNRTLLKKIEQFPVLFYKKEVEKEMKGATTPSATVPPLPAKKKTHAKRILI